MIFYWAFILLMCETRSQNIETSGCECKLCQSCRIGWQVPRCLAQYSLSNKICFSIKIMVYSC